MYLLETCKNWNFSLPFFFYCQYCQWCQIMHIGVYEIRWSIIAKDYHLRVGYFIHHLLSTLQPFHSHPGVAQHEFMVKMILCIPPLPLLLVDSIYDDAIRGNTYVHTSNKSISHVKTVIVPAHPQCHISLYQSTLFTWISETLTMLCLYIFLFGIVERNFLFLSNFFLVSTSRLSFVLF